MAKQSHTSEAHSTRTYFWFILHSFYLSNPELGAMATSGKVVGILCFVDNLKSLLQVSDVGEFTVCTEPNYWLLANLTKLAEV